MRFITGTVCLGFLALLLMACGNSLNRTMAARLIERSGKNRSA